MARHGPVCNGEGWVGSTRCQVAGEQQTAIPEGERCWECQGAGELSDADYMLWEKGEQDAFAAECEREGLYDELLGGTA